MKKVLYLFALLLLILLLSACAEDAASGRTLEEFSVLRKGISYDAMVAAVGPPDFETGSGLHIFGYTLENNQTLLVSFASLDDLLSVKVQSANGEIVRVLIGP